MWAKAESTYLYQQGCCFVVVVVVNILHFGFLSIRSPKKLWEGGDTIIAVVAAVSISITYQHLYYYYVK